MTPNEEETVQDQATDVENDNNEEKQPLSLEVSVESPSTCQRHVTVTISRDDVDRYFDEAFSELMPNASVPGFRPGRAPRKLVESRFRKEMEEQVKSSILMDAMSQVTEDQDFSAISEPDFDFDAVGIPAEGPLTFEFDIEVRPEFDMPEWKGLKLEKPVRQFGKKDVDNQLERYLSNSGHLVPFEGAVEEGDYVIANIQTKHEGHTVASFEEQTIRVRPKLSFRDATCEDFDKLMSGAQAGDLKETTVTLSDNAPNRELRGKEVNIEVEILEVKKLELPELTDELIGKLGSFDNEGELRDAIQESMERQLSYHQQQRVRQQITEMLTKAADWELPPELLERQSERELERAVLELRASGFDDASIQARENELRQNTLAVTSRALKEHFILERIAEDEEVSVDDSDYDREITLIAAQRDESPRRVRAQLEKSGSLDAIRNQIIERKVLEQIESHAEFKDVKFDGLDENIEAIKIAVGGGVEDSQIPEAKHAPEGQKLQQPADRT